MRSPCDFMPDETVAEATWRELWRLLLTPRLDVFGPPANSPEPTTAPSPIDPEPIAAERAAGEQAT